MTVQLQASSSYLWRSLMAGRDVIAKGSIWRVGDGASVDVWRDLWNSKYLSLAMALRRSSKLML